MWVISRQWVRTNNDQKFDNMKDQAIQPQQSNDLLKITFRRLKILDFL